MDDYASELAAIFTNKAPTTNPKGQTKRFVDLFLVDDCRFSYENDFLASWGSHYEFHANGSLADIDPLMVGIGADDPKDSPVIYKIFVQTVGGRYTIKTNGCQGENNSCTNLGFFGTTTHVNSTPGMWIFIGSVNHDRANAALADLRALIHLCAER